MLFWVTACAVFKENSYIFRYKFWQFLKTSGKVQVEGQEYEMNLTEYFRLIVLLNFITGFMHFYAMVVERLTDHQRSLGCDIKLFSFPDSKSIKC